jgi:WD40 repeat protein
MRDTFLTTLAILTIGIGFAPGGEQKDRRGRGEPGLIVETGARMGTCDVLTFMPDGKELLAAGDDKVVRVWPVSPTGLDAANARTLRWTIWHEQRGNIYALAVDPAGKQVAIAGKGLLTSTVWVLDFATGEVLKTLTDVKGNDQAIRALAFSPSGDRIAIGGEDGTVWMWDLTSGKPNDVRRLKEPPKGFDPVRLLVFEDESRLVSVGWDGRVLAWNVDEPGAQPVERFHFLEDLPKPEVYRVAVSADKRWLAAAGRDPRVEIRSLDGREKLAKIVLSGRELPARIPRSLAFDATGEKLAIGVRTVPRDNDLFLGVDDEVVVYDLTKKPPEPMPGPPCSYHAEALAFHPDGRRLALAGGDNHETTLWDCTAWKAMGAAAQSPGNCLWSVGLSANSRYLGFREVRASEPEVNELGKGAWRVFDLQKRKFVPEENFKPVAAPTTAGGWKIQMSAANVFQWSAISPDGTRFPLSFDEKGAGLPLCYTFLQETKNKPVRLAVGQYYGAISLFELGERRPRHLRPAADKGMAAVPARIYVGHQGEIMAIAPSADEQWLVTASRDQTVAAWNLADWPSGNELGARFGVEQGKLRARRVDMGSPAWEAGLNDGDEVQLFAYDRKLLFNRTAEHGGLVGAADECLDRLHHAEPGKEIVLYLKRNGNAELIRTNTTVRQRPQWRFFPTRGREWVLWMWRSYYYDTSTNGDFLIGWHVNKGEKLEQKPDFYPAEKMRKLFHRDDLVDALLWEPKVEGTLQTIVGVRPPKVSLTVLAKDPSAGAEVTLRAQAIDRDNRDQQLVRSELWIDDYRFATWETSNSQFDRTVTIPGSAFRAGANQLTFQCFNAAGGTAEDKAAVQRPLPRDMPHLYGLIVGIDDYSKARIPGGAPENLKYTKEDAREMRQAWLRQVGKLYAQGDVKLLVDKEATRAAILDHLRGLADKARPDDLLVLFLGGHGYDQSVGKRKPGTENFVFCTPTFNIAEPDRTGITSQVLYQELAKLRCRKLVLLDVCHSGLVVNPIRGLTPGGKGPTILASCDKTEAAIEDDKFKHGLFTYALVEALSSKFDVADQDNDGKLDAEELYHYAEKRLPQLFQELMRGEGQNPTRFPSNPDRAPLAEK